MADTTHTLRIRTILDTAQVRAQLAGLQSGIGTGSDSSLRLENAINRLVQSLEQLPERMERASKQPTQPGEGGGVSLRQIVGIMSLQKVGAIANKVAEASGDEDTERLTGGLVRTAGYATSGAFMGAKFGPYGMAAGAAIGTGLGVAEMVLDSWTSTLKESQKELEEWNNYVKEMSEFRERWTKTREEESFTGKVQGMAFDQDIYGLQMVRYQLNEERRTVGEQLDQWTKGGAGQRYNTDTIRETESKYAEIVQRLQKVSALIEQVENKKRQQQEAEDKIVLDEIEQERRLKAQQEKMAELDRKRLGDAKDEWNFNQGVQGMFNEKDLQGLKDTRDTHFKGMQEAQTFEDFQNARYRFSQSEQLVQGLLGQELGEGQSLLQQLMTNQQIPLSNLASIGLGMGENDEGYQQSINEKVSKVIDKLTSILSEMRNQEKQAYVLQ